MRFVVVLALSCCCYAAEQTTSVAPSEMRRPPQHIKDLVEQHIKYVKQQIPTVQQQIKDGKLKIKIKKPNISDQEAPENVKEFIESHITKVLQYASEHKKIQQSGYTPTPILEARLVKEATEQHIAQAINQQSAHEIQLKDKGEHSAVGGDKEKKLAQQIYYNVPQEVAQQVQNIPSNGKDVIYQAHYHAPELSKPHVEEVVKHVNLKRQQDEIKHVVPVRKRELLQNSVLSDNGPSD